MPENAISASGGASNIALAALSDTALDRKIGEQNHMINSALADRARAADMIEKCEKSAVLSAWRLGQFLIEKKGRFTHGAWLPWLDMSGISSSSAANCMLLARQISSAGNLGPSIRATLRALPPASTTPKSKPPAVVEPEPVELPEPDSAAVIEKLEADLYDAEERVAIMEESTGPKSRKITDKLNNQVELIRTLKASVATWQSKHADARREISALKRQIRALETELGRRRPRHAA